MSPQGKGTSPKASAPVSGLFSPGMHSTGPMGVQEAWGPRSLNTSTIVHEEDDHDVDLTFSLRQTHVGGVAEEDDLSVTDSMVGKGTGADVYDSAELNSFFEMLDACQLSKGRGGRK